MRQTVLTYILFISSVTGTMVAFNLSTIVPLMNGTSIYFSQNSAKHRAL